MNRSETVRFAARSLSGLIRGEATFQQIQDVWEVLTDVHEPKIYYGPYDAIWPTIGVEGFGWACGQCGGNESGFSSLESAQAGTDAHCIAEHFHVDMTLVEVFLDADETEIRETMNGGKRS